MSQCQCCGAMSFDDDSDAITEEWLRTLNPDDERIDEGIESPVFEWTDEAGITRLILTRYDSRIWIAEVGENPHSWPDDIHARCQVRDIMRALGIKTTQPREGT